MYHYTDAYTDAGFVDYHYWTSDATGSSYRFSVYSDVAHVYSLSASSYSFSGLCTAP
jgi:hypothetical protein